MDRGVVGDNPEGRTTRSSETHRLVVSSALRLEFGAFHVCSRGLALHQVSASACFAVVLICQQSGSQLVAGHLPKDSWLFGMRFFASIPTFSSLSNFGAHPNTVLRRTRTDATILRRTRSAGSTRGRPQTYRDDITLHSPSVPGMTRGQVPGPAAMAKAIGCVVVDSVFVTRVRELADLCKAIRLKPGFMQQLESPSLGCRQSCDCANLHGFPEPSVEGANMRHRIALIW